MTKNRHARVLSLSHLNIHSSLGFCHSSFIRGLTVFIFLFDAALQAD
jgi:hypothetical protein